MMADRPPISAKQIAAFRAVMEAGSITGAAELMYITQPAVSRLSTAERFVRMRKLG